MLQYNIKRKLSKSLGVIILFIIILIGLTFLGIGYKSLEFGSQSYKVEIEEHFLFCEKDADCVQHKDICCPISCSVVAINKDYLDDFKIKFDNQCRNVVCSENFPSPLCDFGKSVCINNRCTIVR